MRPLRFNIDGVKGLATGHEQAVPLGAAETQVPADLGQHDLPDAVTARREDVNLQSGSFRCRPSWRGSSILDSA